MTRSETAPAGWIRDSALLGRAHSLAVRAHGDQRRATDQALFIEHVVEVGDLLHAAGFDERLVAAGLLHDAVERGRLTENGLRAEMDDDICTLVMALSEDPTIDSFERRKHALREQVREAGARAATIFAADKLSDIRGLARGVDRVDDGIETRMGTTVEAMSGHYEECMRMIEAIDPECPFIPALRAELEAFTVPPASAPAQPRFRGRSPAPGWAPVPD